MKRIWLFLCLFCFSIYSNAQYEAKHVLEVKRFTNWSPKYLTVTNTWNGACLNPWQNSLRIMSIVTAINGQSTENMEENDFYNILDTSPSIALSYMTKINGENKSFNATFEKNPGKLIIYKIEPKAMPDQLSILTDNDIDYFQFKTFDYKLVGTDQLMDKSIMEFFVEYLKNKGLKRSEVNPDLYLYITKDVNQAINSVYVPKYITTTDAGTSGGSMNLGGLGRAIAGNTVGSILSGATVGGSKSSATTVTQDVGEMRTNVNADAYLEFSILDARKCDNKNAPVIWQLVYKEHATQEIKLLNNVKTWIASWAGEYPFNKSIFSSQAYSWGVLSCNLAKDGDISYVVPGSKADQLGIKSGSKIKLVKYTSNSNDYNMTFKPGDSFYADQMIKNTLLMEIGKSKINKGGISEIINYEYVY